MDKVNENFDDFVNEAKSLLAALKSTKLMPYDKFKEVATFKNENPKEYKKLENFILHILKFVEDNPEMKTSDTGLYGKTTNPEIKKDFDKWLDKSKYSLIDAIQNDNLDLSTLDFWDYMEEVFDFLLTKFTVK